jgi:DNA primase
LRLPEHKIEEVRAATNILEVVQGYVSLKKKGQNYFGLCPFHTENTASFSVNPARGIFRCFGCGRGGNVISFLMEVERVSFMEAVRMLAQRAHIELPAVHDAEDASESEELVRCNGLARDFFHQQLVGGQASGAQEARTYLKKRGYGMDVIERYGLGYAPDEWEAFAGYARNRGLSIPLLVQAGLLKEGKEHNKPYDAFRHRIMFPIRNLAGRVIAFGGRRLREDDDSPKYVNSPETAVYRKGRELFGLWEARDAMRKNDEAFLVEGYTDCLSLVMAGVTVAVASLGTALTEQQARLLKRFTANVFILYDGDNAGLAAARRAIDVLLAAGAAPKVIVLPGTEDPDSFVRARGGEAVWKLRNENALTPVEFQLRLATRNKKAMAEATRELVASAALITSPVEQDVFLQDVAGKTGVSLDALRRELTRVPKTSLERRPSTARTPWPPAGPLTEIARVLVRRPELRGDIFEIWTPTDIADEKLSSLFQTLREEWQSGADNAPETLLDRFPESPVQEFLADCLFEEPEGDATDTTRRETDLRMALDCLRSLEATGLREQLVELKQRLAESPSDAELLKQIESLLHREKDLRSTKRN